MMICNMQSPNPTGSWRLVSRKESDRNSGFNRSAKFYLKYPDRAVLAVVVSLAETPHSRAIHGIQSTHPESQSSHPWVSPQKNG
jgi:hypothetical protein